jgi:hypothetical protein
MDIYRGYKGQMMGNSYSMFTFGNDIVSEIDSLMKKGSHETF